MNRDDYLSTCAKLLGRLVHEIKAQNAIGRFDINSVTEDFLLPIVKVIFDCPDLKNQNQIQQNFPAIDLGCRKSKVSFQVTTDASSEKVESTLTKFRQHGLGKDFDSVYILALTEKQSIYKAKSLLEIISELDVTFDVSKNILDMRDLLQRLKTLDTKKLEAVAIYLESEFKKHDKYIEFRDQLDKFVAFATSKIEVEKTSRKYIPSVFAETKKVKEQMRFFVNPTFFARKIHDELTRVDYTRLNSLLRMAKQSEVKPEFEVEFAKSPPEDIVTLGKWADSQLAAIDKELAKIGPLSWYSGDFQEKFKPADGDQSNWRVIRFPIESVASGLTSKMREVSESLRLTKKQIFLITGMAGQGKTNFVCNLVESQLAAFEVPCVYVPGRELNRFPIGARILSFVVNNRYSPRFENLHDCLKSFNEIAKAVGKPFMIIIDGINEVSSLDEFRGELCDFCNAVCQYEYVKTVITCRNEFFEAKFSSILDEPFRAKVHRVNELRSHMSERSKEKMLRAYLRHFKISGDIVGYAEDFLQDDLLMLRIFCEQNQGRSIGRVSDVYKGEVFEEYLGSRIKTFPEHLQRKALPVLFRIVSTMLDSGNFSNQSVRKFDSDDTEIVRRLVSEDVVLREEIAGGGLSEVGDFLISFTYDELRDFVIAYMLVDSASSGGADYLETELERHKKLPIYEGVFRYVYLLARKRNIAKVVEICEATENFLEHYSLNFQLIPPAVQNADDVTRLSAMLMDVSAAERVRRAASTLVHRPNLEEQLNINLLIKHMNGLDDFSHGVFVKILFSQLGDYPPESWQKRIDKLANSVCGSGGKARLQKYNTEWLVFFLHVSSLASWAAQELVSAAFRNAKNAQEVDGALRYVRSAKNSSVAALLLEIDAMEVAN
jgi:hypothetical protein